MADALADPDGACGRYFCDGQVPACASACDGSTGSGCKPDSRCDPLANACVAKLQAGSGCGGPTDCQSGFCVDGVCCGGACDGICELCNLPGLAGTCFPAAAGTDPDGDCAANGSVCTGRREIPGVQEACAPTNSSSCAVDGDCVAGLFCALPGNLCVGLLPNGTPCDGNDGHCGSGTCSDGVCCDVACGGECEACNLGAATGTCTPVPAGWDPESECGLGFCGGNGACVVCTKDLDCKPGAYCNAGTCTAESPDGSQCGLDDACSTGFCTDGACCDARCLGPCVSCVAGAQPGVCTALPVGTADVLCGTFRCGANGACATGCAADADCASGSACVGGSCASGRSNGAGCLQDADCASGACVAVAGGAQVCCESACDGLCMACDAAGACGPVAAGQDPRNECAGTSCDGRGNCKEGLIQFGSACAQATDCATGFCVDGFCCESACNGTCESCDQTGAEGLCLAHPAGTDPESECGSYQCDGRLCGTACAGDVQCKDTCTHGVCGPPQVQYTYGAWSPWSGCGVGDVQETRTRECIENGAATVDCGLCVAVLGGGGCSDTALCPDPGGGGGGGGACAPLNYNVCVQSLADCQSALSTRQNECMTTGCGQWTVTTACSVGGSPSNPNCWGAQATCGPVQQPVCAPLDYNVCTMVSQADCQSTVDQLRTRCLTSGCNSFYAAPCTVGGSPSNAFCWGSQAQCGMDLVPPPVCSWSQAGFHALTSQPPGSWYRNGGINGQGPAFVGGRVAWLQTSDWNHLYVPSSLAAVDDVVAVSADVYLPADMVTSYFALGVMSMSAGYNDLLGGVDYYFERPTQKMIALSRPAFSTQDTCCTGPTPLLMEASSPTPFAAEWHRLRVEFSRQRSKLRFYVDGVPVGTATGNISWMYDPIRLDGVSSVVLNPANVAWSNIQIERGTAACLQ